MKSISFKNFRRFSDFPEFKFGNITILVGSNNAGKSTLQKALLLVFDNIRSLREKTAAFDTFDNGFTSPQFRFDANEFHDLKLGTFERSLFAGTNESKMEFTLCVDSFIIRTVIEPDNAGISQPIAKVALIEVNDTKRHILYTFDFNTRRMRAEFEKIVGNGDPRFDKIQERVDELRATLEKEEDPFEAALCNQELQNLLKIRNAFVNNAKDTHESSAVDADMNNYLCFKGIQYATSGTLSRYIENIEAYTWSIGTKEIGYYDLKSGSFIKSSSEKELYSSEEDLANRQVLDDKKSLILESASSLQSELANPKIFYIQAHGISQKILYTIDDKNDFMAQAIHKFARCAVKPGTTPDSFLRKWMEEFGIGKNYIIESFGGEGYTVKIETNNGWVNLADLGMGSNQLMVLLFSLATIMYEHGHHGISGGKSYISKFIIIEEPEQNLHPRLQSKLADLFATVAEDESYNFLVETHSEYLIRRTQVLVAEMNLSEEELEKQNPFKVYYFPSEGIPYDMKYTNDGHFEETFGTGFFDEAGKWTRELTRNKRR